VAEEGDIRGDVGGLQSTETYQRRGAGRRLRAHHREVATFVAGKVREIGQNQKEGGGEMGKKPGRGVLGKVFLEISERERGDHRRWIGKKKNVTRGNHGVVRDNTSLPLRKEDDTRKGEISS